MTDNNSNSASGVVTRFAPSPTGYLHIGGARTALFNWLYAKANGGKMLLRIEDTDRKRSNDDAVTAILDGLSWMGLQWDGEPYSQFERAERHKQVAEQMVADGTAYYCFATPEELSEMRELAKAEGRPTVYDGRWRDRDPSQAPEGAKGVIRLKAPREGLTIVADKVQGEVKFPNKDLDDLVLLRSDGSPTYMLAVVVDDHDMGVTHIIRGDDHLTNAGRQTLIYQALGWEVPVMAHIPLIHGADGAKLSKRHGALGAEAYRAMGYLPEALRNYLVRLGWSHGDDEIMSTDEMTAWFGFDGMNKAAARFDFAKLEALNGHYIRHADDAYLAKRVAEILPEIELETPLRGKLDEAGLKKLTSGMTLLKERAKTLLDLIEGASFLFVEQPMPFEEKALAILTDGGDETIKSLLPTLEAIESWTKETIETAVKAYAEPLDLKLGKVAQPLRSALTGKTSSPGVFDVLELLGKDECLNRLKSRI
ncbi:MAG: glutamate--tRNA ligase [Salaquimonas sp.]